jgi:tight adherence protein B
MALLIAVLVFVAVFSLFLGMGWTSLSRRNLRERLGSDGRRASQATILKEPRGPSPALGFMTRVPFGDRLAILVEQAGLKGRAPDLLLACVGLGVIGLIFGWLRPGGVFWALIVGAMLAVVPIFYVTLLRQRRVSRFQGQFPDALDMMTRSIRAGHALSGAIRTVGDEMPAPIAEEFAAVSEEIRLGLDPAEALYRLEQRIPTEDVTFFCTAIRIQRMSGGNLAEVLDRLAEVMRERFKLLSQARALSAQHRFTAIAVGLSPVIFAIVFEVLQPGYFEPLLSSPFAPAMIGAGVILEIIGFVVIWKIANIKV